MPLAMYDDPASAPPSEPEQADALVYDTMHVEPRQQTPGIAAHGLGEQVVAPPGAGLPQRLGRLVKQAVPWQQAIAAGHGSGLHVVPASCPVHALGWATIEHAPVEASQQALGWGQGLGSHAAPAPWKVLPAPHPGWATKVHEPVPSLQHAPGWGQGVGEQTVFAPCQRRVEMPVQTDCVRIVQ